VAQDRCHEFIHRRRYLHHGCGLRLVICHEGSLPRQRTHRGSLPSLSTDLLIHRSRHIVQDRPLRSVRWADIPGLPVRDRRCPAAWQQLRRASRDRPCQPNWPRRDRLGLDLASAGVSGDEGYDLPWHDGPPRFDPDQRATAGWQVPLPCALIVVHNARSIARVPSVAPKAEPRCGHWQRFSRAYVTPRLEASLPGLLATSPPCWPRSSRAISTQRVQGVRGG
jgi:hypothetical protein